VLSQAVILCGAATTGRDGTSAPLALRPFGGKPFLEHLIQDASRFGIDRITILTDTGTEIGALYDGRTLHHCAIEVLGVPAGANPLRSARDRLAPSFLLLNGACWSDADLVVLAHRWHRARSAQPALAGMVLMQGPDAHGLRGGADAASPGTLINTGVYILQRDALARFWTSGDTSLEAILTTLSAQGRLRIETAPATCNFLDMRDPARSFAHRLISRRTRPALFLDRDGTLNVDRGYTFRPAARRPALEERRPRGGTPRQPRRLLCLCRHQSIRRARGFFTGADVEAFHASR